MQDSDVHFLICFSARKLISLFPEYRVTMKYQSFFVSFPSGPWFYCTRLQPLMRNHDGKGFWRRNIFHVSYHWNEQQLPCYEQENCTFLWRNCADRWAQAFKHHIAQRNLLSVSFGKKGGQWHILVGWGVGGGSRQTHFLCCKTLHAVI